MHYWKTLNGYNKNKQNPNHHNGHEGHYGHNGQTIFGKNFNNASSNNQN
jgi:hypothetical protein